MTSHLHILKGCAPVPLANYLKALGILRLVSEQADDQTRGWWQGERFCMMTKLSRQELEAFFLERYEPTPMLSPWNKGCGFFKPDDPGMAPIEESSSSRFQRFRSGIKAGRDHSDQIATADAVIRAIKARTKTTRKGFQTDTQRGSIERSDVYKQCVVSLQEQLSKPDLSGDRRAELKDDITVVCSIVSSSSQPPSKAEAKGLKESRGYKLLLAAAERRFKAQKSILIPDCRREWRGRLADWMAAAVVLDEAGEPDWPSLLGTGGNDGNLDFTNNFMQQLIALFDTASEQCNPPAAPLLNHSFWEEPANTLSPSAIGQYQPGSAGGPNSSTGFDGGNLVNPWDFVLMMEGTILFASQATRRLEAAAVTRASAPFAVRSHAAGFATPGSEKAQRGEQWMPLWHQPATIRDISAMLGEGRVQLGRKRTHRPVDVARAISRLGVARGIESFVRYGYLERNGQSTLAVPLGRVAVRKNPRSCLIDDLADWMNNLERRTRDKNAPNRLISAERRLADAVFAALTLEDESSHLPNRWQAILLAAADVESLQASGTAFEAEPIPRLQPEWVSAVDDGSAEIRLALALGSTFAGGRDGKPIDSIRHHWLPLQPGGCRFKVSDKRLVKDPRVVATGRDPLHDLARVVERRLIEATMDGERRSRLRARRGCAARLDDVAAFLAGQLDLDLIVGLGRAFMAIQWDRWTRAHAPHSKHQQTYTDTDASSKDSLKPQTPDEAWLALRLCMLPDRLDESRDIPADERIVRLVMTGNVEQAIEIARRRLIGVGIRPPFQAGTADAHTARFWAAALAFPISQFTARRIAGRLDPRVKPQKGLNHV